MESQQLPSAGRRIEILSLPADHTVRRNLIPWGVRGFISDQFPLLYHIASHVGKPANSSNRWDERLAKTWDHERRVWPTKNEMIQGLTHPSQRIIDVGRGNGSILRHLLAAGYKDLHGLELSQYAVERLAREGITMHRGKLPTIDLADSEVDVVIASQILEHLVRRHKFMREIRRVLRPSGPRIHLCPRQLPRPNRRRNPRIQIHPTASTAALAALLRDPACRDSQGRQSRNPGAVRAGAQTMTCHHEHTAGSMRAKSVTRTRSARCGPHAGAAGLSIRRSVACSLPRPKRIGPAGRPSFTKLRGASRPTMFDFNQAH